MVATDQITNLFYNDCWHSNIIRGFRILSGVENVTREEIAKASEGNIEIGRRFALKSLRVEIEDAIQLLRMAARLASQSA